MDTVIFIRPPGMVVPGSHVLLLMFFICYLFFYFTTKSLSSLSCSPPWLPHDQKLIQFYNPAPKFGGLRKQFLGPKHAKFGASSDKFKRAKKSAKFSAVSNIFILWSRIYVERGHQNSEKQVINYKPSRVERKKLGGLWSTKNKV